MQCKRERLIRKLSNNECSKTFDKIASRYDEISNVYAVSRRRDILVSWAKGYCLEVGAGTGQISRGLIGKHRVVATDISANMVAEIKTKLNIDAYVSDAERLPFPDALFDTVIAAESIYYLNHPEYFILEAHRVLKPSGRLLISCANNINKIYERLRTFLRLIGFRRMYFDDKNRDFMTARKLEQLLSNGGFKVKSMERIIVLPFGFFDFANKFLENSLFKYFATFLLVYAEKL